MEGSSEVCDLREYKMVRLLQELLSSLAGLPVASSQLEPCSYSSSETPRISHKQ